MHDFPLCLDYRTYYQIYEYIMYISTFSIRDILVAISHHIQ